MKRALIVDDIKENLYLLESLLKAYGFIAVTANNGAEALGLALKEPPDIIIADILMPVMDGYTLCREWKKDDVLKHIPFVFYTATYTHPKDGEFALSLGADKFIIKPQEPEDFMAMIEQVLSEFRNGKIHVYQTESSEVSMLKEYNETLIRKMEDRMLKSEEAEKKIRIYASQLEQEIEQRKQAELELIEALKRAEESDRLKSAFLANMSHEVRTPLNSIIGFSELLSNPEFDQAQKNDFIQYIINSGNNLLAIINDIMDISKLESGELQIYNRQLNVHKFISTVKEQFVVQARAKGLELELILPENSEETIIHADANRLMQIFNNLASNAIKFTSNGRIEIGYQPKGTKIEFYIRDTGIGIAPEYHHKIFERFRQIETSATRKFGGNGLGLAISKNLVELMGGEIWVESEIGKGAKFCFTINH
jgi:signal transduction histidine kinase